VEHLGHYHGPIDQDQPEMQEYGGSDAAGHAGLLEEFAAAMSGMRRVAAGGELAPSPFCNLSTEHSSWEAPLIHAAL
jgi:hypothetical protein